MNGHTSTCGFEIEFDIKLTQNDICGAMCNIPKVLSSPHPPSFFSLSFCCCCVCVYSSINFIILFICLLEMTQSSHTACIHPMNYPKYTILLKISDRNVLINQAFQSKVSRSKFLLELQQFFNALS